MNNGNIITNDDTPIPTPKKTGRPKGRKTFKGLTVEQRLDALKAIIKDKECKPADRITAIKMMTDLLQDKVQTDSAGVKVVQIKFDTIPIEAVEESKKRFEKIEESIKYEDMEQEKQSDLITSDKDEEDIQDVVEDEEDNIQDIDNEGFGDDWDEDDPFKEV